jgi:signal transduction histidine kinase
MPTLRAVLGEEFDDCRIWVGKDPLTKRALSVSARSVRDRDGTFAGAALAYKDVTDFMQALRVKDDFVASVSHELRTPLTSIRGYADLLLDQDLPPLAVRQLEVVVRNAERLQLLVGDLLHSAQTSSGSLQVVRAPCDLAVTVRDALGAAGPAAAATSTELLYSGPPRLEAVVDPLRMRQVVDNLLSNAIKYSPPGTQVVVRLGLDGDRLELSVADQGFGIDAADRDRLFTRFWRSRHAHEQSIQGAGLGLSITKAIVEGHGGRIEVDSEVGVGTMFRVRLPVQDVHL